MSATLSVPGLSAETAQLRFHVTNDPIDDEVKALVTVNDTYLLVFFRHGDRLVNFMIETFRSPGALTVALEYRYQAREISRAKMEETLAELYANTSQHTFASDLRLAFNNLDVAGLRP